MASIVDEIVFLNKEFHKAKNPGKSKSRRSRSTRGTTAPRAIASTSKGHLMGRKEAEEEPLEAAHFDCLILAFDDSIESVQFCERSLVKLKAHRDLAKTLPVLFLHIPSQPELSKSPVQVVVSETSTRRASELCKALSLALPISSGSEEDWRHFYERFVKCMIDNPERHMIAYGLSWVKVATGILFVGGIGVAAYVLYQKYANEDD